MGTIYIKGQWCDNEGHLAMSLAFGGWTRKDAAEHPTMYRMAPPIKKKKKRSSPITSTETELRNACVGKECLLECYRTHSPGNSVSGSLTYEQFNSRAIGRLGRRQYPNFFLSLPFLDYVKSQGYISDT